MNVKEYIKSGAVESYVLGIATDAERSEFEQMSTAHTEVLSARDAFERLLEQRLMEGAVAPPVFLKGRIEQEITPAAADAYTREETREAPVRRMNVWAWVAAACFIALLGVGYWAYSLQQRHAETVARHAATEQQLRADYLELVRMRQDAEVMRNPAVRMTALRGTPNAPQALSTVFWDSTTKDVYLFVNNLPQAASDKQYQLWALLNGQPIDLGMLVARERRLLVKMKNVQNAQAFAITLEPKGGSESPTLDSMYVSGNL